MYTKSRRNFLGIPSEFFTEFRQSFSTEFRQSFSTKFRIRGTRNSVPRNSAETEFRGIFTEFRVILFRRKNSAKFLGTFKTEFIRNSGFPMRNSVKI